MSDQIETSDRLYTLQEARRELARRECVLYGHRFDVVERGGQPVILMCERCRRSWQVGAEGGEFPGKERFCE